MKRFLDKVAIVTGGTSGIGAQTARQLAREGCHVILVGRNEQRGQLITREIGSYCVGSAEFHRCDVRVLEECQELQEWFKRSFCGLDLLFNNAGVFITKRLEEIEPEEWEQSFSTNVNGTLFMTKLFMDPLIARNGCIINNASISGLQSYNAGTKNYMYGASKAAVIKLTKLCALNYAGKVRVNAICPGIVDTEIFSNRDFSRFDGKIPMGRLAKPEEIARVVLFLASEDASYITGAVLPIDGGMSI